MSQEVVRMDQLRDRNATLLPSEIEAIKTNQEIIKRMADNSVKTKNIFLTLFAAAVTFHKSIQIDGFILLGFASVIFSMWFTDAKYLQLEKQFRKHHNAIIEGRITYLDQWDFNPAKYEVEPVAKIMFLNFTMWLYWLSFLLLLKIGLVG